MLNSHQDYPQFTIPLYNLLIGSSYHLNYYIFHSISVLLRLDNCWPLVMGFIDIIPIHLIDSNRKYFIIVTVNPSIDYTIFDKLIDKKCCSMTIVEY